MLNRSIIFITTRCDGLYSALKPLKETVKTAPVERRAELSRQIKAITQDIRQLELQIVDIDTRLQPLLLSIPNIPQQSVRDGDGDDELRRWGEPISPGFDALAHWDIGERLGIINFETGAKIAGSRFVTLQGAGARLERALISFMLDLHTREHGDREIMPPYLVKRSTMLGAGQLPKFEDQAYVCTEDELYLNPTAEVPLVRYRSQFDIAARHPSSSLCCLDYRFSARRWFSFAADTRPVASSPVQQS